MPAGDPIKPWKPGPRIGKVGAILGELGYLQWAQRNKAPPQGAGTMPSGDRYSGALVAAVKKLQSEYGFKPDGIIGGNTLDALNADPAYRARELAR